MAHVMHRRTEANGTSATESAWYECVPERNVFPVLERLWRFGCADIRGADSSSWLCAVEGEGYRHPIRGASGRGRWDGLCWFAQPDCQRAGCSQWSATL